MAIMYNGTYSGTYSGTYNYSTSSVTYVKPEKDLDPGFKKVMEDFFTPNPRDNKKKKQEYKSIW